jgi:hypothetical protein
MGKTLTASQQKEAIADLQSEAAKRGNAADAETTASVKPADAKD